MMVNHNVFIVTPLTDVSVRDMQAGGRSGSSVPELAKNEEHLYNRKRIIM